MARNTLTFELGGQVSIKELEEGIHSFHRLVRALTPRRAGISWIVEDHRGGSAITTLRGEAEDVSLVDRVVHDYEVIGETLQGGNSLEGFRRSVFKAAEALRVMANKSEYVRIGTPENDFIFTIKSQIGDEGVPFATSVSVGAISGRVETLSRRGNLRFNLYDAVFDRPVACYLADDQEDLMREAWGKRARVTGRVYREPKGGRPFSVRAISKLEILPEAALGGFRKARGAVEWHAEHDEASDVAIRRLRDA